MSKLTAVQIRQAKPQAKPYTSCPTVRDFIFMSPSLEKAHGVTVYRSAAILFARLRLFLSAHGSQKSGWLIVHRRPRAGRLSSSSSNALCRAKICPSCGLDDGSTVTFMENFVQQSARLSRPSLVP